MVKKKPTHRRISSPAGEGEKKVAEGTETREKLPVAVAENPGRKVSSFLTAKQKKKRKNLHLNRESANPGFEKRGASGSVFLLTCTLVFCCFFFCSSFIPSFFTPAAAHGLICCLVSCALLLSSGVLYSLGRD